ncbi:MAG: hypothetical protein II691_08285 [Muribaculaceae bacterium]|nr:hypothetical protein [Muribaculaceae bacterium]MBQ3911286.1 hypothetical protein [Muribaculaceae bacterium]
MNDQLKKKLEKDETGLLTYEYIANNINNADLAQEIDDLVDNIINVDKSGQFVVSTARYLNAIDKVKYNSQIDRLIKAAIVADRERAYLPDLAASIWGNDYKERASSLIAADDNFRRIYKRLYPIGI